MTVKRSTLRFGCVRGLVIGSLDAGTSFGLRLSLVPSVAKKDRIFSKKFFIL
jgi:hypothetical protein